MDKNPIDIQALNQRAFDDMWMFYNRISRS